MVIEPTRIKLSDLSGLLGMEELVRLAIATEWLIVEAPTIVTVRQDGSRLDETKPLREKVVCELAILLPAHKVWEGRFVPNTALLAAAKDNAAGSQLDGVVPLCIRKVVSETSLEDRLDLLISVAFDYRELANALMHLLAQQLNVDVSRFAAKGSWHDLDQSGQLRKQEGSAAPDGEWSYFFHGQDCAFRSLSTGRTVEARLGFGPICGDDFGVFDPGFFLGFINSSLASRYEYQPIADLLCDWWENARLALELMEDRGVLRRVSRRVEDQLSWVMNRDAADSRRL